MSKGKSGKAKPPANRGEQQGAVSRRQAATAPLTAANRGEQQVGVSRGQAATAPLTQPRPVRKSAPERFWYVEVAAVRIQSWIARTPRLRFRRGASNLLIDVTSRARILPVVPVDAEWAPNAKWAPDAGEVSGVVTVQFSGLLSEERARTAAVRLAGIIAAEMRSSAPALEIQAGWGVGSSYLQAFPDIRRRVREQGPLLDIPAVMAEAVSAQPCQECQAAAAVHQILVTKQTLEVCVDCRSRAEWAGALGARTEEKLPKAQQDLAVRVAQQLPQGTVLARPCLDLTELANCAQHLAPDDTATQLALVEADGNRVGAFLREVARGSSGRKYEVVEAINSATAGAVAAASVSCFGAVLGRSGGAGAQLPVLAHFIGGDDVMVSVPAAFAWPFTVELSLHFERLLKEALPGVYGQLPSLSAGVVFHHFSAPFSDVVRLAGRELLHAKQSEHGLKAAVSFLDLTADGDQTTGRRCWTVEELTANAARLDQVAAIPPAQRNQLLRLLRERADAGYRDLGGESPEEALQRRLSTMDIPVLRGVVVGAGGGGRPPVEGLDELRRWLDVARWWRSVPPADRDPVQP